MKTLALSAVLTAIAVTLAPVSRAEMHIGNYALETARDPGHAWIWAVRPCPTADCVHVQAIPQPNGQAAPYDGDAQLVDGRYTMSVDVPDGVRCVVAFYPSHDTYSWDAVTLSGSVQSSYETGCGGGPGGTDSYPFTLTRW